jgi:pimeloyl-ACP methyl ester carboxylesterase
LEIERSGAKLFFTTMGKGPDVMLLHPTPLHHEFWLPVAERLAPRYRLILPDLRGHGKSTVNPDSAAETITMGILAEDVRAVLGVLGVGQAAFAGCSTGGYALYEFGRRFPGEMAALALVCGKPQADTADIFKKRQESIRQVEEPGGLTAFFEQGSHMFIGPTAQQRDPNIRAEARAMMNSMGVEAVIAVQKGLGERPDSVPTLKTIQVPVCAIAGDEDPSSTPAVMRTIPDSIPGAEFHLLRDTGHYAPLEQPEAVAEILVRFLDRALGRQPRTGAAGLRS